MRLPSYEVQLVYTPNHNVSKTTAVCIAVFNV